MKKKILSVLLTIVLLAAPALQGYAARLNVLYQKVTEVPLAGGVVRQDYQMLSSVGWINANVVKVDLTNPYLNYTPIFSDNGISNLVTTKTLANQNNAIAAVNADFFAWAKESGKGSPVGLLIKDGQMLSSPANNNEMAALVQYKSGENAIVYPTSYIAVVAPNGNSEVIRYVNKYDSLSEPCIYTNAFKSTSLGSGNGVCEAVVKDGIFQGIRYGQDPVELDDNTYVIAFLNDYSTFMLDNFQIGDPVVLSIATTPSFDDIQTAIGGGTQLVTNGAASKITHQISGANPRSAAGFDQSGNILYLITVDGRGASRGISLEALQEFMISIGVYNGVNLDGGGSTMLATKELGDSTADVANQPSENRAVSNALAVVSSAPQGTLSGLTISADRDYVFKNTSCNLITKGYDQYLNSADPGTVSYSVSGVSGHFDGSAFFPTSSGTATITATSGSAQGTFHIRVLDQPNNLTASSKRINLDSTATLTVTAKDADGFEAPILLSDLQADFTTPGIVNIAGNTLTKTGNGNTVLKLSLGDAATYVAISTNGTADQITLPGDENITDYMRSEQEGPTTFTVFGGLNTSNTMLSTLMNNLALNRLSAYNKHFFVGEVSRDRLTGISNSIITNGYGDETDDYAHYIWLNNRQGGLRQTSTEQWQWLINRLTYSTQKNILIFLPVDVMSGGFTDQRELQAFYDTLYEYGIAKGKNVMVFANGSSTNVTRINGIRYVTTAGVQNATKSLLAADKTQYQYITVTPSADGITYNIKSIFQ